MTKINLKNLSTQIIDKSKKDEIKLENTKLISEIIELQRKMYAQSKHSLLIVIQGMDASGKDGAVRRTLSGVNPNGIMVKSFKKPTEEELIHDFLWRVHPHIPAKGMIQVFNRSHYEDILIPTVYDLMSKKEIDKRYDAINHFESQVESNGTTILKFYLHTSIDEQYKRLMERVEIKEKHFKHNDGDWETRKHWDKFEEVYENIFLKCNSPKWTIVPSDKNWEKVNVMAKTILIALKNMDLNWPDLVSDKFGESK
jgi:PPK2 family polyphosphate:nucleotide phosphotransferase